MIRLAAELALVEELLESAADDVGRRSLTERRDAVRAELSAVLAQSCAAQQQKPSVPAVAIVAVVVDLMGRRKL